MNGGWGISYEIALRWMALDLTDNKSTLVQVMAWYRQATSHYLSQCWPRSMSPNGVTRPQWVKMVPSFKPGSAFIKPDQLDRSIKVQIKIILLPTISHLPLPNFVSCGRACPSHMTQNLVTVGAKLWTAERFLLDPWSMDYADPVW